MPDIEITDDCRALIESSIDPLPQDGPQRLSNGNWRVPVDASTLRWLDKLRRNGETISDCIIRIIIVSLHKRGLQ
ncbi:hypothetical protein [Bradyrhizobium sp. McL0616]|uniref:hypothetical protein n=1 Tax=Bradyrhizobium sp. McL0616 TaxID=3415674 RepID=UPI003CE6DF97